MFDLPKYSAIVFGLFLMSTSSSSVTPVVLGQVSGSERLIRLVHQRSAAFSLAFDRVAGLTSQAFDLFNETLYSFSNCFFLPCRGSQHRKEWCGSVLDRGNPAISDRTCSSHISLFHTRRSEPEDMEESSQRQITERKVNLTNFVPPDRVTWWAIDWTALGAMRLFL